MPLQANSVITLLVNSRRWSSLRVMFSLTKKLCGNYLYWLNILYLKFFHLTLKNRVCREIFHCIEYIFYHSGSLSNLRLCWKTEFALKFFTVGPIEYTFTFRIFEQLALVLKNRVCLEIFHCRAYWVYFYIQDLWATCACPKNSVSWINWIEYIFFTIQDFWATCACPEIFHCIDIFFITQDFWATCACPENRVALKFFTVLIYFLSFRIFEQLALSLN